MLYLFICIVGIFPVFTGGGTLWVPLGVLYQALGGTGIEPLMLDVSLYLQAYQSSRIVFSSKILLLKS